MIWVKCHLHVIDGMGAKYMNYGFSLSISGDMRLSDAGVCLCVTEISRGSVTCLTLRLPLLVFTQRNLVYCKIKNQ